jgi:hypothetical protein
MVWLAIALHITQGTPAHPDSVTALTAEGVMMDLVGLGYDKLDDAQRQPMPESYPHPPHFAEAVL